MTCVRSIVALCVLLVVGSTPLFACPAVVRVASQAVAVVQTQFVATPLVVPVYGAGYSPNQGSNESAELLRQLLEEIRGMRAEMKAMQSNNPVASAAMGKNIVEASCIGCHQPALSGKKGGGFDLIDQDGNLLPLSDRDRSRINARVALAKNMPPGKPLPPDQAKLVVDFLTQPQAPPAKQEQAPMPVPAKQPLAPSLTPKEEPKK